MLGQTIFLLCIVGTHREVWRDLQEASRITDFLRRQKQAEQLLAAQKPTPPARGGGTGHRHSHSRHASLEPLRQPAATPSVAGKPSPRASKRLSGLPVDGTHLAVEIFPVGGPRLENAEKRSEDGAELVVVNLGDTTGQVRL